MKDPKGLKILVLGAVLHSILAIVKISTGILGHSYALIADGIESLIDLLSSILVWSALKIANLPPDENHPYGHGKAESLAALFICFLIFSASLFIAFQSILSILHPHKTPAPYTLFVLGLVILVKEGFFRILHKEGEKQKSQAMKTEAFHQRSDALTSLAAFLGISIALIGGKGYESADDWAALFACIIIFYNGVILFRTALDEIMDAALPKEVEAEVRKLAESVMGVECIEKCRIRKSGPYLIVDIHIQVLGDITVGEGHTIGHNVKKQLCQSHLSILDVHLHIEPFSP